MAEGLDITYDVLITGALREDETALWEEMCPAAFLKIFRKQNPCAFAMQYSNDTSLAEEAVFKRDNILRWKKLPENLRYYQGIDPAITEKSLRSDCTAIMVIGVQPQTGNVYVAEYIKKRILPDEAINLCAAMYERWNPISLAVEAVAFQRMLALALQRKRIYGGTRAMRILEVKPEGDKVRRILTLEPLYAAKKVYHPEASPELDEELLKFKPVANKGYGVDDLLDAFAMVVNAVHWYKETVCPQPPDRGVPTRYCGVR